MRTRRQVIRAGGLSLLGAGLGQLPADARAERGPCAANETPPERLRERYDVIVAGAGTGGVAAALQAARLGASVLLVESTDWIGGQMTAAGVSSMDEGYPPRARVRERGVYGEFHQRTVAFYRALGQSTDTSAVTEDHFSVEPHVAQQILYDILRDTRRLRFPGRGPAVLDLSLRTEVTRVHREGDRITGVTLSFEGGARPSSRRISSTVLIDATEYGDLLPLAGVRYRLGNRIWDRPAGENDPAPPVQPNTWTASIRHYPGGAPGRLLVKTPPPGYNERELRGHLSLEGDGSSRLPWNWPRFLRYRGMPDSTLPLNARNGTDLPLTRTHVNFSPNDHPLDARDVEDPRRREDAEIQCRLRTLGVIFYFQNVLGKTDWSVADDIGYDTPYNRARNADLVRRRPELAPYGDVLDHFPVMAYVRESRRIVGAYALTAREIRRNGANRPARFPTAVALGDYPIDVHGALDPAAAIEPDLDLPEDLPLRWTQWGYGPFQVPFACFIPETVDGLVPAEKNLSQSRLASGATRLQPSTMLTGQAAGAIAALAVRLRCAPRAVPPLLVQDALLDAGSTLSLDYYTDLPHGTQTWKEVQLATLYGLLDTPGPEFRPGRKARPEEIEAVRARLREVRPAGTGPEVRAELVLEEEAPTRAELARQAARALRALISVAG
jgi:hypothetical protein